MTRLERLLEALGDEVVVQTHDYPDIDAIAAAHALASLLRERGVVASVAYSGELAGRSLGLLMSGLGIQASRFRPDGDAKAIVVVDGSPANGNVLTDPARVRGVIDHHDSAGAFAAAYLDIRRDVASSSAIVASYWFESDTTPSREVATALLAGIMSDTDFFARRSTAFDFSMYSRLFGLGDFDKAAHIVRTVLSASDLGQIGAALREGRISGNLFFARLPVECTRETLAVVADFLMRVEEIEIAVLMETGESGYHLSVRSKTGRISAFDLLSRALEGIGTGGGHSHSAGGFVEAGLYPGDDEMARRFAR